MVGFAALAVVLLWGAYLARSGILMVYLSALMAAGMSPLTQRIQEWQIPGVRRHLPRWLAALAVYLVLFAVVVAIGIAVLPSLVEQAQQLVQHGPPMIDRAQDRLLAHGLIPHHFSTSDLVQRIPSEVRSQAMQQFTQLLGGVVGLLLILVLSIYLLHDAARLRSMLLALLPAKRRDSICRAADRAVYRVGAWMTGQLMLCGIIGASTAIVLGLLGVPYFYVLGLVAAVGEVIPYAGPLFAAVPGILLAFTSSWQLAVVAAVFYLAQQQIENNLLVPKLMQHQVGLPPSLVIIAITIGSAVLGVLGAVIAVPSAAIIQVAAATWLAADEPNR